MAPNHSNLWLHRLTDFLLRNRLLFLFASIAIAICAWPVSRQLEFDQTIESLYADNDPQLKNFVESKRLFGGDEFVLVAFKEPELFKPVEVWEPDDEWDDDPNGLDPNAFDPGEFDPGEVDPEMGEWEPEPEEPSELTESAAARLRNLAKRLSDIPGVVARSTQDLATAGDEKPVTLFPAPDNEEDDETDPPPTMNLSVSAESRNSLLRGVLLGEDNQTTAVAVRLMNPERSPISRSETIFQIRIAAEEFTKQTGLQTYVVGEPLHVQEMFRLVEQDGDVLFRFSFALLALVIFACFLSLRWVVLPLMVVIITIVTTEALLVFSRLKLSMVSSILNSLVTIISVATVTHVTVRFREHRTDKDRVEALRATLHDLLPAIFWTCVTTAVGFVALLTSEITPVQSFGLMMSGATAMVLVTSALVLPGGILLGNFGIDPHSLKAEAHLSGFLVYITHWVEHHPRLVLLVAGLCTIIAGIGMTRLEVETDFTRNFRKESLLVQSVEFVEDNLGGAGTWEINFDAPPKLNREYLARVERLAERIRTEVVADGNSTLTKVVAITDGTNAVPHQFRKLSQKLHLLNQLQPEFVPSLYNRPEGRMRIVLRSLEQQQSNDKHALIDRVLAIAREEFPEAKATGLFVLLAFLIDSLMDDQLVSFTWAVAGIWFMLTVAFTSLRTGLISLVPNLFPIVAVIGVMGWVGVPINIATAMIASVSMGLTVDSSIHFIMAYRKNRANGATHFRALHHTHQRVGRALVFANQALILGFSALTLSHFIPLVYFGILVSVAMLGGLMGNLLLLPVLLAWSNKTRFSDEPEDESVHTSGGPD